MLLLRQSIPQMNCGGPQDAPLSGETRMRIDGSGHWRHSFASIPVVAM